MSTPATLEPASKGESQRPQDEQERRQRGREILNELLDAHNVPEHERAAVLASLRKAAGVVAEAREPFPFSEQETMGFLTEPMTENWMHPLTNLAHKLLLKHHVIDEPFMIGGVDKDGEISKGVVCACFYGTVRFRPDEIRVYSNWGAGNMCPEILDNLVAIHPTPPYLSALMPRLEEIVNEQMSEGCKVYKTPKRVNLKAPDDSPSPSF